MTLVVARLSRLVHPRKRPQIRVLQWGYRIERSLRHPNPRIVNIKVVQRPGGIGDFSDLSTVLSPSAAAALIGCGMTRLTACSTTLFARSPALFVAPTPRTQHRRSPA